MSTRLSIAEEFSRAPAGRYRSDGPYSGEEFREKLLAPRLKAADDIEVDLTGVMGFGSSFLEEAFGGLVRAEGLSAPELRRKMRVRTSIRVYEQRIWKYIEDAQKSVGKPSRG